MTTFQELLQEAERRFPVGTEVNLLAGHNGRRGEYTIEKDFYKRAADYNIPNVISYQRLFGYLYYKGQWANYVSLPEIKENNLLYEIL